MSDAHPQRLSREELDAEACTSLPAKEVISLLDLNVDLDLALNLAAPIDLAVAANANVAAPIDAAASANLLSLGSSATSVANQGVMIDQYLSGEAIAEADQTATVGQADAGVDSGADGELAGDATTADPVDAAATGTTVDAGTADTGAQSGTVDATTDAVGDAVAGTGEAVASGDVVETVADPSTTEPVTGTVEGTTEPVTDTIEGTTGTVEDTIGGVVDDGVSGVIDEGTNLVEDTTSSVTEGSLLDGNLLNVDVDLNLDADVAAPIAGAVAANANIAAPIDAAVAANIGTVDSEAIAVADQTAIITQRLEDVTAQATVEQDADVTQ